jgi:molybdopterin-guanine dinucleotide biosynthesis protein MobB
MLTSFHSYEVAFCGYSGVGKTTLVTQLIQKFSEEGFRAGYVKHDAHRFTMDYPGKDTWKARESGAAAVMISDSQHWNISGLGALDPILRKTVLSFYDFVLVEGFKDSEVPKLIMIDEESKILREIALGKFSNLLALIGPWPERPASFSQDPSFDRPYFCRDQVHEISEFVRLQFYSTKQSTPLYGLALSGGHSTRMGQDKGSLHYHHLPQVEFVHRLLEPLCERSYISIRAEQKNEPIYKNLPQIHDQFLGMGPLGGLLSAMRTCPDAAWLIVACDMPLLNSATLQNLIAHRNPFRMATAYLSAEDGQPEPLCSLWEPHSYPRLLAFLGSGVSGLRSAMMNSPLQALPPVHNQALKNVNQRQDFIGTTFME